MSKAIDFGISEGKFNALTNILLAKIYEARFDPEQGWSAQKLGEKIRLTVDQTTTESGANLTKIGKQCLIAEAVCGWVASRVRYDGNLANLPYGDMDKRNAGEYILASSRPTAVCNGFARTTKLLITIAGKDVGLRCEYVGGYYRNFGETVSAQSNHAWNVFIFDGEVRIPSDTTMSLDDVDDRLWSKRPQYKLGWTSILPRHAATLDFFFARHYAKDEVDARYGSKQNVHQLTSLTFEAWARYQTGFMATLVKQYCRRIGSY